jgi:hypothetical protein
VVADDVESGHDNQGAASLRLKHTGNREDESFASAGGEDADRVFAL